MSGGAGSLRSYEGRAVVMAAPEGGHSAGPACPMELLQTSLLSCNDWTLMDGDRRNPARRFHQRVPEMYARPVLRDPCQRRDGSFSAHDLSFTILGLLAWAGKKGPASRFASPPTASFSPFPPSPLLRLKPRPCEFVPGAMQRKRSPHSRTGAPDVPGAYA